MVKCHRKTGAPRHFKKNQQKHQCPWYDELGTCLSCAYVGRASGDRVRGFSLGKACFNKSSKNYMRKVSLYDKCSLYTLKTS